MSEREPQEEVLGAILEELRQVRRELAEIRGRLGLSPADKATKAADAAEALCPARSLPALRLYRFGLRCPSFPPRRHRLPHLPHRRPTPTAGPSRPSRRRTSRPPRRSASSGSSSRGGRTSTRRAGRARTGARAIRRTASTASTGRSAASRRRTARTVPTVVMTPSRTRRCETTSPGGSSRAPIRSLKTRPAASSFSTSMTRSGARTRGR